MKKLLLSGLAILALTISSCKDDNISSFEPPANYEDRLAGTWNLERVIYDTEIPDLTGGTGSTPVHGEGTNVSGTFTLSQDPNEFDYEFRFGVNLMGIALPINQQGSGTWTTTRDDSKIIVTDESGEEIVFNVIVNEEKKQVYTTTVTQNLQNVLTLDVDLELEFSRP